MKTMMRLFILLLTGVGVLGQAQAQAPGRGYPEKPVKVVVPFSAGSSLDVVARLVAQKLAESFGQPVVIENQAGAGGNLGTGFVAKSEPDGYTLLHTINSTVAVNPALYPKLSFDPTQDLVPVVGVASQPLVLVVNPSFPAKTLQEFIAQAKSQPGKLFFGSAGAGAFDHLAGELLFSMAGLKLTHVPYKGSPAAQNDLMAGRLNVVYIGMAGVPLITSGKLKPLAVSSSKRARVLPNVPTVAESGLPTYEVVNSNSIFAPARTPKAIIERLNGEVLRILALPDVRERFEKFGVEPVGGKPEELAARMKADAAQWKKLVAEAGIKPAD